MLLIMFIQLNILLQWQVHCMLHWEKLNWVPHCLPTHFSFPHLILVFLIWPAIWRTTLVLLDSKLLVHCTLHSWQAFIKSGYCCNTQLVKYDAAVVNFVHTVWNIRTGPGDRDFTAFSVHRPEQMFSGWSDISTTEGHVPLLPSMSAKSLLQNCQCDWNMSTVLHSLWRCTLYIWCKYLFLRLLLKGEWWLIR